MQDALSNDEYDALAQVAAGNLGARPSACVSRNAKRLAGLKYVSYRKDGVLLMTDKGTQTMFIRQCIDGLRALLADPMASLTAEVQNFLGKKGHVAPRPEGGFVLSARGRESLDDIEQRQH